MAFKKNRSKSGVTARPSELFRTLTRRKLPDVMTHQREILDKFFETALDASDVAIQLPTGSGKTLVALLIAEWKRRNNGERVVYLCPTKQLANQIGWEASEKYGIEVEVFTGSNREYSAAQRASFTTGSKVAVTTYSSLFNSNPFFSNPDTIVIDDAHAAENYIVKMWSLSILPSDEAVKDLHRQIATILRPHIPSLAYARLTGDWQSSADATWFDKVPTSTLRLVSDELRSAIDSYDGDNRDVKYTWPRIRGNLDACHLYLGSREVCIRPILPPTWTHGPFENASQRIFMSATLGEGGDLERLTGREKIRRIEAPKNFRNPGVGRRLFMFPELSLDAKAARALRTDLQKKAGRSVILTTSHAESEVVKKELDSLPGFKIFDASDIEDSKQAFVQSKKAVVVMAGRFDGIDFPEDECRFLCLDGLPKAANIQERFLVNKMGASALLRERMHTRVLQAAGRCTRALQDRSAVCVIGDEIVQYLADNRNWKYFHPDVQAELDFGVEQSVDLDKDEFLENFDSFLANDEDWEEANSEIIERADGFEKVDSPGLGDLEKAVGSEIRYLRSLWDGDVERAYAHAKDVLGVLDDPDLRGYRAWWHYLAGSAADMAASDGLMNRSASAAQYEAARKAAPALSWLSKLGSTESTKDVATPADVRLVFQVENIESVLYSYGTLKNNRLRKKSEEIRAALSDPETFEEGLVDLGRILGFEANNSDDPSGPDPWWLVNDAGIVFEANVGAKPEGTFKSEKCRQAAMHPDWLHRNVAEAKDVDFVPIIITPKEVAAAGSESFLEKVKLWDPQSFASWFDRALQFIAEANASLPPETDLAWRSELASKLSRSEFTIDWLRTETVNATDGFRFSNG